MYLQGNTLPLTHLLFPQRPHFLLFMFPRYAHIYKQIPPFFYEHIYKQINIHEVKTSWFRSPTYMTTWETKLSTHEALGIFQIQTILHRLEGLIDNLCTHSSKSIEKNTRSSLDMSHPKKNMPKKIL